MDTFYVDVIVVFIRFQTLYRSPREPPSVLEEARKLARIRIEGQLFPCPELDLQSLLGAGIVSQLESLSVSGRLALYKATAKDGVGWERSHYS